MVFVDGRDLRFLSCSLFEAATVTGEEDP